MSEDKWTECGKGIGSDVFEKPFDSIKELRNQLAAKDLEAEQLRKEVGELNNRIKDQWRIIDKMKSGEWPEIKSDIESARQEGSRSFKDFVANYISNLLLDVGFDLDVMFEAWKAQLTTDKGEG